MRHTFFFDLDGTLLPLDMDAFTQTYYAAVAKNGFLNQIDKQKGKDIFGKAIHAMIANDGRMTNEETFFRAIKTLSGVDKDALLPYVEGFYRGEFTLLKQHTRVEENVREVIALLKRKGYRLVLATNPLFPAIATNQRIDWAGLKPDDFEYISYYHNSSYCKPNPGYFEEILGHRGLSANDCYIVGNDVRDDMSALALGFEGFLVLDHVVGNVEKVPECKKGDYSDLLSFAESLPQI